MHTEEKYSVNSKSHSDDQFLTNDRELKVLVNLGNLELLNRGKMALEKHDLRKCTTFFKFPEIVRSRLLGLDLVPNCCGTKDS